MLIKQPVTPSYDYPISQNKPENTLPVTTPPVVTEKPKADNAKETKEKYQKFVSEIAKYSVNMNDFDFEHMLKNVFDIGGKLGLKPDDIFKNKEYIKKFLPKVGEFIDKAQTQYNNIQTNSKASGETQVAFTDGKLVFKTGQEETTVDADGNVTPLQQEKKDKTQTELDLKGMNAGIQTEAKDGSKFSTKVDIDDKTFGYNFSGENGAGQSTVIDLKKGGFTTNISPDGKNNFGISSEANGHTSVKFEQKGAGSVTLAGGGNKGTTVAVKADKLGGVQVNAGKHQQTVVSTNVKTKKGEFGTTVRTGNDQGTQVNLNGGKYGSMDFGVNSNGVKVGLNVNGTGGAFNLSRSNNAVNQTVKDDKITTTITDNNKWDGKVTYKDEKLGTIGLNMSKQKADSRSFITSTPDNENDIKCKQEDLNSLSEEKKKIIETPKSKRTDEQNKRLEAVNNEIKKLDIEIENYGKSIESKTEDLMYVPDEDNKSDKFAGHETAKQIPKGDVYKISQERKLTFGGEFGAAHDVAKVDNTTSKKVSVDLSVEGLGNNKVKINVSRDVEFLNKTNVNIGSGIGTFEGEFGNDKSASYELELDLNTKEGQDLYDKIMSSSSNFRDKLPIPQESSGVRIISSKTEDTKTKDENKTLNIPSVVKFSTTREHEINKTISSDDYEMKGDFTKTSQKDGEKIPVLGNVFADEKKVTNGNYSITPSKQEQIKNLEAKKQSIESNNSISPEQKETELEVINDKIDSLQEDIQKNNDSISEFQQKKQDLIKTQALSPDEKTSQINDINKQIEQKKEDFKNNKPIVQEKVKSLEAEKEKINAKKDLDPLEKNSQLAAIDKQINSLKTGLDDIDKSISSLESKKIELRLNPEETKNEISKIDAKINELQNDSKTSFKITINDSRVHNREARKYNDFVNNVTNQDNHSALKTRQYNDKSTIGINLELFADPNDIQKITTSSRAEFIKAAKETPKINRNGDGVKRFEIRLEKAEERANKTADEKGLKKPSPERDALIQAEKMDVVMDFVERNGKDGVAFLQKLTGGKIEVKTSDITVEGLKAENIIADDKIKENNKKSAEIGSDNKVDRKEAKEVRHMKKEALDKKEDMENKLRKIDNNPILTNAQKAELKANINIKLEKLNEMIGKLNALEYMREETVSSKG